MFKEQQGGQQETETIIGPSVKIEGDFVTEGNIVVEGMVCGKIKTVKDIRVGAKSKIFANVTSENALISGEVQGNIKVRGKLELTSTAKIFGDIKADTLIVAAGSVFNGKCQMGNPNKDKAQKPDFSKQGKIALVKTASVTVKKNKGKKKK